MKDFDTLLTLVENHHVRKVAVAAAEDPTVIQAAADAKEKNIAESVLIGNESAIREAAESASISLDGIPIVANPTPSKPSRPPSKWFPRERWIF